MITILLKNKRALQIRLLPGVVLITFLLLTAFSQITSAHAAEAKKTQVQIRSQVTCASDPTGPHCNNQNPVTQGCSKDVQTLSYKEMIDKQGVLLATVQRRYSPTCHSEWGRILQSPNNHRPVSITIAKAGTQSTLGPVAFSPMVFVPDLSVAPEITGEVIMNSTTNHVGDAGLAVFLPA